MQPQLDYTPTTMQPQLDSTSSPPNVPSLHVRLSRNYVQKSSVSVQYHPYGLADPKLDEDAGHISRNCMRRAVAVCRASKASIKAKTHAAASEIHEVEEYLGLLRAKHAVLQCREADAIQQLGQIRDALDQSGITEFSQSDDEDGAQGHIHTYYNDTAHYPPSSDLPSFEACGSSESDSDSEEYPTTATPQDSTGAIAVNEGGDDVASPWDIHQMRTGNPSPDPSQALCDNAPETSP